MSVWLAGAAVVGAGATLYASNQAAQSGKDATKAAAQQNAATLAQQNNLTRQQLEIQRPVIQTRDAALNQLNAFFGLPQTKGTDFNATGGMGSNPNLVMLPGITANGVHSKQTNTSLQSQLLSGDGTAALVPTGQQVKGGGTGGGQMYYDRYNDAIVDSAGNIVRANASTAQGDIAGAISGFNNGVQVNNGTLYGVGSKGAGSLNIQLKPLTAEEKKAYDAGTGGGTAAPFDYNSVLSNPAFEIQRRQGTGVINRNLAAQGKFFSGQRGNALLNYNNDLVRSHINEDYVNPRLTLAGYGTSAAAGAQNALTNQSSNLGQYAANYADTQANLANARNSGYAGTANAITSGIGNYLQFQQMQRQPGIATTQPVNQSGYISNFSQTDPFGLAYRKP